jgi:acetyl esterase/lipase
MRWVRAHSSTSDVNPDCIGIAGASYGGNLAAFLGMGGGLDRPGNNLPVSVHANIMVLLNPVLDMTPRTFCTKHAGTDYKAVSSMYFIRPGLPPTLILQAESEKTVSPPTIANLAASMKCAGNDCTLDLYPNVAHGFFNAGKNFYNALEQINVFLAAHGWLK